jgi:acyl carrier protein
MIMSFIAARIARRLPARHRANTNYARELLVYYKLVHLARQRPLRLDGKGRRGGRPGALGVEDCEEPWYQDTLQGFGGNLHSKWDSAMNKNSVRSIVATYIIDNLLLGAADELDAGTQLMEAGILDSTGVMELVAFLETNFGIAIAEEEIIPENLNSLDNICNFISLKSS